MIERRLPREVAESKFSRNVFFEKRLSKTLADLQEELTALVGSEVATQYITDGNFQDDGVSATDNIDIRDLLFDLYYAQIEKEFGSMSNELDSEKYYTISAVTSTLPEEKANAVYTEWKKSIF